MERRARPRIPGWNYALVRWDSGEQSSAIIWDLSDGGVAVEVAVDAPRASRLLLALASGRTQVAFPLTVVARDRIGGRPLVHARFENLSEAHRDILRTVIADWRRDMDRRQVWLTTRRNDVASRADLVLPGDVRPQRSRRKAS